MPETKTALGSYLYTKRITRGYESISRYLAKYSVGISESYYRDIETGRKLIRIQSAEELCEKLALERRAFYFFLLRDILPEDVFNEIVSTTIVDVFRSANERSAMAEATTSMLSKAVISLTELDDITELDETSLRNLEADEALLGTLHFIYAKTRCTFSEIDQVYRECGGNGPVAERLATLIGTSAIEVNTQDRLVSRRSKNIRVPTSPVGRKFKDKFTIREVMRSLEKDRTREIATREGTLQHSVIVPLSQKSVETLALEGFARFVSMLQTSEASLDEADVRPYFAVIMVSTRDEYNAPTHGRKDQQL